MLKIPGSESSALLPHLVTHRANTPETLLLWWCVIGALPGGFNVSASNRILTAVHLTATGVINNNNNNIKTFNEALPAGAVLWKPLQVQE